MRRCDDDDDDDDDDVVMVAETERRVKANQHELNAHYAVSRR